MDNQIQSYRICVIGAEGVGKTSIVQRLIGNPFIEGHKTEVGFDDYEKLIFIEGHQMLLSVQDLSRSEEFPAMEQQALQKADMILVVFSLCDFESCRRAVSICHDTEDRHIPTPLIVVGNKSDCFLGTPDSKSTIAANITHSLNRSYIEMSAKYDDIDRLVRVIYEEREILRGPYRVLIAKETKIKKILSRTLSFSKLFAGKEQTHGGDFVQSPTRSRKFATSVRTMIPNVVG